MVVIRLSRGGNNKNPFYRIVVADSRKPRDGRYIEHIGYYNPMARGSEIRLQVEQERVTYWVGKGAIASDRVQFLLDWLEESPEAAQKAGPRKGEMKRIQAEASVKAQKKAAAEAKKAEIAPAPAAEAEASTEKPVEAKPESEGETK